MGSCRGFPINPKSTWPLFPFGALLLALFITACGTEGQASLEERAQSIDRSLICPVCPGETVEQAQVELARQMRTVVREKLAQGWDRDQILQFFVDRYGESVLAAPPKSGFSLVAWVVPLVAVAGAAALLYFVVRAMRKPGRTQMESGSLMEQGLAAYLSLVDRELGIAPSAGSGQVQERSENPAERGVSDPEG